MDIKRFILETIETIITSIIVLLIIYSTIALPEVVWGSSMEPNFETNERILVDKLSKVIDPVYTRGEVVVLKPQNSSRHLIKRIIGVPGDIFKIYDCNVYVNQDNERFVLEEDYLAEGTCTTGGSHIENGRSFKLQEDEYVALGDNRAVSLDSRSIGVVTKDDIIGRVSFRFWPIAKIGFVR